MRRLILVPMLVVVAACPRDTSKAPAVADTTPVVLDTTPADLSGVKTSLPPAAPDTFTQRHLPGSSSSSSSTTGGGSYPAAPQALMDAVQREQSFTRFCYQEFGQKSDPSLTGGVAMIVSVGASGISDARVGNSKWSSAAAGSAVNRCLNERAKGAWKLAPGAVSAGKYVVPLVFRGG